MKLYTKHCPKCNILNKKIADKGIEVEIIDDEAKIKAEGMDLMPVLELDDGTRMGFAEAVKWVNEH